MHTREISWSDFEKEFKPGPTYPVHAPEIEEAIRKSPERVWTLLNCDGISVATNGVHLVNRTGYLITEVPAPANTFIEVADPEDLLDFDDDDE